MVSRSSCPEVFLKFSKYSRENTCARVFFDKAAGLTHLTQVFSCEFYEIRTSFLQNTSGGCFFIFMTIIPLVDDKRNAHHTSYLWLLSLLLMTKGMRIINMTRHHKRLKTDYNAVPTLMNWAETWQFLKKKKKQQKKNRTIVILYYLESLQPSLVIL